MDLKVIKETRAIKEILALPVLKVIKETRATKETLALLVLKVIKETRATKETLALLVLKATKDIRGTQVQTAPFQDLKVIKVIQVQMVLAILGCVKLPIIQQ
jgi:hypothetical protein